MEYLNNSERRFQNFKQWSINESIKEQNETIKKMPERNLFSYTSFREPLNSFETFIKISVHDFKFPFCRIDLLDVDNLMTLLENYCENFSSEPRHSALQAVRERADSSFTRELSRLYFKNEVFEKIENKLKPTFKTISDLDLFRRNLLFILIYTNWVKTIKPNEPNLECLKKVWVKWLIFKEEFKFLPICVYLKKNIEREIENSKLATIKYLHWIIVDELEPLNSNVNRFYKNLDRKFESLYGMYHVIKPNRTSKFSEFTSSEKEIIVFLLVYSFATNTLDLDDSIKDRIQDIMIDEGISITHFKNISMEIEQTGLF